ncbi:MAG: paraquat-inducible protein A [Chromatiales bacterium]|nr:paraquat-inducible protein A [Chromatiales bacterium]
MDQTETAPSSPSAVNRLSLTLFVLLLGGLLFCAWHAWQQALAYEQTTLALIDELQAETKIASAVDKVIEMLSMGTYSGYSDQINQLAEQKRLQEAYRHSADLMSIGFFALVPLALLFAYLVRCDLGDMAYAALLVAMIALAVGLSAPILSLAASKELPVLGETVFQFQSKGVLSTITALQSVGNLWLAAILFLFSVVIPVVKSLLVGMTFFARTHHLSLKGLNLVRHIGKWSMADVFVVAILVAFFSSNGKGLTDAEVQAGLYFFAGYVVLSVLATQLIDKLIGVKKSR